jgi:hypothetical protein
MASYTLCDTAHCCPSGIYCMLYALLMSLLLSTTSYFSSSRNSEVIATRRPTTSLSRFRKENKEKEK